VMNLLLIPKYGINGAATATIISHIWISVISYVMGNRLFKIKWPLLFLVGSFACVSITFFVMISL
jgi:O-antigen/teichoic acid export membrane protein